MARNPYFTNGTGNEQNIIEDIIVESLGIYGQDFFYIPRTLVSKDEILGEDRLSLFKDAYPIEMYLENVDGFEGQGAFIQKFGLMMEQTATLTVARRTWTNLVGVHGNTIIPTRPCEGDLLYFPLTKGMFEIKFVQHQDPFYQLGKLYVYKLQVELFQYASERIDTGVANIDAFETLKTFSTDTTKSNSGQVTSITVNNQGSGYISVPSVTFTSSSGTGATATAVRGTGVNINKIVSITVTNAGTGYQTPPVIKIGNQWTASSVVTLNTQLFHLTKLYTVTVAGTLGTTAPTHSSGSVVSGTATLTYAGLVASATAIIENNIDKVDSFGDNNKFKTQAKDLLFTSDNPFGEIDTQNNP